MNDSHGKSIWGEMRPLFEEETDESRQERKARVVSRFALTAMFALFVRTLLWVLDGVFYTNPAEIRIYSVAVFLVGGIALWQILDFKSLARKLFIGVAVLTWGVGLASAVRTYQLPISQYSSIQIAEYVAFMLWVVVSVLFVLYLIQPRVRELFTESASNPYQRALFVLILGQVLFFEWKSSQSIVNWSLKLGPASGVAQSISRERFQRDCAHEERTRLPAATSDEAISNYCRCDSKLLEDRCPGGLAAREQCLHHIEVKLGGNIKAKAFLLEARESCVAQYFPKEQQAVHQKARAVLERNVLQRLSVALPLEKIVAGETAQRKLLYCTSLALFSRCRDPKPSASYACLSKAIEPKESEAIKSRCLRLAQSRQGDFEVRIAQAEAKLGEGKYVEAVAAAEKAIALGSDRSEGYLVRGLAQIQTAEHKGGIEDLTIVLKISDFTHTRVRALEGRRIGFLNLKDNASAEADARDACVLGATSLCPKKGSEEPSAWRASEDIASSLARAVSDEASESKLAWSVEAPQSSPQGAAEAVAVAATAPVVEPPQAAAAPVVSAQVEAASAPVVVAVAAKLESERAQEPAKEAAKEVESQEARNPSAAAVPSLADDKRRGWEELMQVGDLSLKTGDAVKAQEKYLVALRFSESLGQGNELWIESSLKLAGFLREAGQVTEGEAYLRKTFSHWPALEEKTRRKIVEEAGRYSASYQGKRQWKLQERILLEIWKQASASDSLLVREINMHLSALYNASGKSEKLDAFYRREAEIYEKRFGKKDARAQMSRDQLATYSLNHGESAKATPTLASPVSLPESR